MKVGLLAIAALGLASCSHHAQRLPLTDAVFEQAKIACSAPEAERMTGPDHGIAFRGVSKSQRATAMKAQCLTEKLSGYDVGFIGFMSTEESADADKS